MPFENGVDWNPIDPDKRGLHRTTSSAFDVAFKELSVNRNPFFDSLADNWHSLFPGLPVRPGRYEDGKIFLYVKNASMSFLMRPKLRMIAAKLMTLPGAPRKIDLRLEQHVL